MKTPSEQRAEYKIEEAVINNFQVLGYRNIYPPIRRVQMLDHSSGVVDLMLLPKDHQHRLVLVEAKHSSNAEAGEKVIGQLLKYYVHGLEIGANGLRQLQGFSEKDPELARKATVIRPQRLFGGVHRSLAFPEMKKGTLILPKEIGLYIAVDGEIEKSLERIVSILRTHHNLNIGVIQVVGNTIQLL